MSDLAAILSSMGLDLPTLIRTTFTAASATVLLFTSAPVLNRRYLRYGKTAAPVSTTGGQLDTLQGITVPHSFFLHYYIVGLLAHLVSGWQLISHGPLYVAAAPGGGMCIEQVLVVWAFFAAQLTRRIYECLYVQKPGTSKMLVMHYLLGLGFYLGAAMAMVVEGSGAALEFKWTPSAVKALVGAPSAKTLLGGLAFVMASGVQHDAHAYLASLKKYSLPIGHPIFRNLVAPHYTAECVIYTALAVMAAPDGQWINKSVASTLLFVIVNLSVASKVNREWYENKFGRQSMEEKWNIIPGIY